MYLYLLFGIFLPRAFILLMKLLTDWFNGAVGWFWIILGMIAAPFTLLWYVVVQKMFYGQWGFVQILVLVVAIIVDLFMLSRLRGDGD